MRFSICVYMTVHLLFFSIVSSEVHAQTHHSMVDMQKDVMIVAANTLGNQIFDRIRYNPLVEYSGSFRKNTIYYHNPGNPEWRAGLEKDVDSISCRIAQNSLNKTGMWSGHLRADGSCGDTAEPVEWALGNWINFNNSK